MSKSPEDLIRELETGGVLDGSTAIAPSRGGGVAAPEARSGSTGALLIIIAVILVAVIGSLPFGSLALYPFGLFVTLLHETGHALATIITGGSVASIQISPDLSGLEKANGGVEAIIAPAGYLGATLAGVALLLTPLRHARIALGVLAAVPLAALLLFHPSSFFTAAWALIFAAGLIAAAWKLSPRLAGFLQIFLGVEAGLNAFRDLMTLLLISSTGSHIQTDADNMSRALFLPSMVWAVLWAVISVALLAGTMLYVMRRDLRFLRG